MTGKARLDRSLSKKDPTFFFQANEACGKNVKKVPFMKNISRHKAHACVYLTCLVVLGERKTSGEVRTHVNPRESPSPLPHLLHPFPKVTFNSLCTTDKSPGLQQTELASSQPSISASRSFSGIQEALALTVSWLSCTSEKLHLSPAQAS